MIYWFFGLPCSGKTSLANKLAEVLRSEGKLVSRLDGDVIRGSISKDLGYTEEDRKTNLERALFLAKLCEDMGAVVIASFITPYESVRQRIKEETKAKLIWVKCDLSECKLRDQKGLYLKRSRGDVSPLTFETPSQVDHVIDTSGKDVEESFKELYRELMK